MTSWDLGAVASVPIVVAAVSVCVGGLAVALVLLTAVLPAAAATLGLVWRERSVRARRWRAFEQGFRDYVRERGDLDRRRG